VGPGRAVESAAAPLYHYSSRSLGSFHRCSRQDLYPCFLNQNSFCGRHVLFFRSWARAWRLRGFCRSLRLSCPTSSVSSGVSFVLSVPASLLLHPTHRVHQAMREAHLSFLGFLFGTGGVGASLKNGKGVHGSRVIWCFLCTHAISLDWHLMKDLYPP
jgi:hypothetical protein